MKVFLFDLCSYLSNTHLFSNFLQKGSDPDRYAGNFTYGTLELIFSILLQTLIF